MAFVLELFQQSLISSLLTGSLLTDTKRFLVTTRHSVMTIIEDVHPIGDH
jgi:hypothetical protein